MRFALTRAAPSIVAACLSISSISNAQTNASPAPDSKSRTAPTQLPNLGDGSDMTSGDERRLGERIARELYRDPDYIDDPILVEYVDGIWRQIGRAHV